MTIGGCDEATRLAAVRTARSALLPGEQTLRQLVHLASAIFEVPVAVVVLLDEDTQIYVERAGTDVRKRPRQGAICSHTIERHAPLVVLDASIDPTFRDNPFVQGEPHLRFYAGVPIRFLGQPIGTFCLVDTKPRAHFGERKQALLKRFGAIAEEIVLLRATRAQAGRDASRFERMAATLPDAFVVADQDGTIVSWNRGAETLFGRSASEAIGLAVNDLMLPRFRYPPGRFRAHFERFVGSTQEVPVLLGNGSVRTVEFSTTRWREDGRMLYGSVLRDISDRKEMADRLHHLAHHDALTELPNRAVFQTSLRDALKGDGGAAVLLIDLDGFKDVNDKLGHAAGDEVLQIAARRLRRSVSLAGMVARLGGDEFLVLLPGCAKESDAGLIADGIIESLSRPFEVQERTVHLSASIGVALGKGGVDQPDDLLSAADLALYQAKQQGRHCRRFYAPAMREKVNQQRRFTQEIRRAVEKNEFVLFYQPQFRLPDNALIGAEALIRWRHPEHGLLSPAAFLDTVESSHHAVEIGNWVIRSACRQAARWRVMGRPDFKMAVNVCASQVRAGTLAMHTLAVLAETGLPARNLELEITERIALGGDGSVAELLRGLRGAGVGIAFDDYGTGYASLSVLKDYPLTSLKIDRSFVREMSDGADVTIIRAILQLAKGFGLRVVAEGIETKEQLARLREKGCGEGQGYLFSPPVPADIFERDFVLGGARLTG